MLDLLAGLLWFAFCLAFGLGLGILMLPYWFGLLVMILLYALWNWLKRGVLAFLPGVIHFRLPPFDWAGFTFYGFFTVVVVFCGWVGTRAVIGLGYASDTWTTYIPWVAVPLIIQLTLFIWSLIPTRK